MDILIYSLKFEIFNYRVWKTNASPNLILNDQWTIKSDGCCSSLGFIHAQLMFSLFQCCRNQPGLLLNNQKLITKASPLLMRKQFQVLNPWNLLISWHLHLMQCRSISCILNATKSRLILLLPTWEPWHDTQEQEPWHCLGSQDKETI